MSEDWAAIAAEVDEALASVGFTSILEQRVETTGSEGDTYRRVGEIVVVDDRIARRDAGGMVTGSKRVLTVSATGVVPEKGWRVEVRGEVHRIAAVMPLAPGGVDLLFDLELEG